RTRRSGRSAHAPGLSRLSSKPARLSGPAAPFCIAMQVAETVADSFPTRARWPALICIVAGLGFVFDVYEIVVQPIPLRPVLLDLGGLDPGTPAFNRWAGWLLFFPPATGGLFGLLGGYLTDRYGRQRVLVFSIVLYGAAAVAAGFATTLPELLAWRCVAL